MDKEKKLISFVGRMSPEKRPELFMQIAKEVHDTRPGEFHFVMVGNGSQFNKIRRMVQEMGLNECVTMTGELEDIRPVLEDSYLLLVTSRTEGIPYTILEAMAMEVPVISTYVGAVNEAIDEGKNGFLITEGNDIVTEFSKRIFDISGENINYNTLKKNTRSKIESKFSKDYMKISYNKLKFEMLTN